MTRYSASVRGGAYPRSHDSFSSKAKSPRASACHSSSTFALGTFSKRRTPPSRTPPRDSRKSPARCLRRKASTRSHASASNPDVPDRPPPIPSAPPASAARSAGRPNHPTVSQHDKTCPRLNPRRPARQSSTHTSVSGRDASDGKASRIETIVAAPFPAKFSFVPEIAPKSPAETPRT